MVFSLQDAVVCNNEKLASGSSAAYIDATKKFLASTVFKEGTTWPSAILAPSNLEKKGNPNVPTKASRGELMLAEW